MGLCCGVVQCERLEVHLGFLVCGDINPIQAGRVVWMVQEVFPLLLSLRRLCSSFFGLLFSCPLLIFLLYKVIAFDCDRKSGLGQKEPYRANAIDDFGVVSDERSLPNIISRGNGT